MTIINDTIYCTLKTHRVIYAYIRYANTYIHKVTQKSNTKNKINSNNNNNRNDNLNSSNDGCNVSRCNRQSEFTLLHSMIFH